MAPPSQQKKQSRMTAVVFTAILLLAAMAVLLSSSTRRNALSEDQSSQQQRRLEEDQQEKRQRIKVFGGFVDDPVAAKQRRDLANCSVLDAAFFTSQQQRDFLSSASCNHEGVVERFDELVAAQKPHLAQEIFKYCALFEHGGVYWDGESPLLVPLEQLLEHHNNNIAIKSDYNAFPNTLHGSLLVFRQAQSNMAYEMLRLLVTTPLETLDASPLLIPRQLYDKVQNNNSWMLLEQKCSVDPLRTRRVPGPTTHACPPTSGYCCHAYDAAMGAVFLTKHPLVPYQVLPDPSKLPKPYNDPDFLSDDLPFIATVTEEVMEQKHPETTATPNFYDLLSEKNCLPSSKECSSCLREKKGATCTSCRKHCSCYCKALCHTAVEPKVISKQLTVHPPLYSRDPNRLVPRIIHQTWFEDVSGSKYPNMSRLIESWRSSGWEYKFYTDTEAKEFLRRHFPPEILGAYQVLNPGAFRADLFRYCVLLIYGGVYADMDVMLESNLDQVVAPDVGFMVPSDEPGKQVDKRMCLWNGFIAVAPGHPFLAKVIETIVNNVRNRFTSVDMDNAFCPDPELSILHAFDTLFTAGPCILGGTVNKVLGRHGQTQYEPGQVDPWSDNDQEATAESTAFVLDADTSVRIPGRTVVLKQNKSDMGAHRFTLLEKNMVVAATDMPDYDDRENLEPDENHKNEHYSKTHVRIGIYGLEMLYANKQKANEDIRILVNGRGNQFKNQY